MNTQTMAAPAPTNWATAAASRVENGIGRLIEAVVGLLVVVEMLILFSGVVSRYVFHRPLTWSDELASILFLWLAMLGAVVAYRRLDHMRMGALVAKTTSGWRVFFDALSLAAGMLFLALVLHPAIEYALDEAAIVTPALEIPNI